MALAAAQFLPPNGPLTAAQFGVDDLSAYLAVWIADAEARASAAGVATDGDEARAWVLYRAYDLLCLSPVGADASGRVVEEVDADDEGRVRYASAKDARAALPDYCALAARFLGAAAPIGADTEAAASPYADWPAVHSLR